MSIDVFITQAGRTVEVRKDKNDAVCAGCDAMCLQKNPDRLTEWARNHARNRWAK